MSDDRLHVVFGTGQVGNALAAHLAGLGHPVRAVSRHRPPALAGVDWRAADAADPEAAADAAKGAAVIYQCLNAPYNQWPERFPPLQRGVLAAAERSGALLVSLENLYGYGPTGGRPMTEDLPLALPLGIALLASVPLRDQEATSRGPTVTGSSVTQLHLVRCRVANRATTSPTAGSRVPGSGTGRWAWIW